MIRPLHSKFFSCSKLFSGREDICCIYTKAETINFTEMFFASNSSFFIKFIIYSLSSLLSSSLWIHQQKYEYFVFIIVWIKQRIFEQHMDSSLHQTNSSCFQLFWMRPGSARVLDSSGSTMRLSSRQHWPVWWGSQVWGGNHWR